MLTSCVITGLVPVIPITRGAALFCIGMAGTGPAMTVWVSFPRQPVNEIR